MFKREMKINLKSFIIWLLILIVMFLVVFLIYPTIINNENIEMMDEMIKMFPEEVLKADIAKNMKELPIYKCISKIEIREEEFVKTTTKKIKR